MTREEMMEALRLNHDKRQKTKDTQWKFNFAFWTLIAASIYFLNKLEYAVPKNMATGIWILFVAGHFLFILPNQLSLAQSRSIEDYIYSRLSCRNSNNEFVLNIRSIVRHSRFNFNDIMWIGFQVTATLVLGCLLFATVKAKSGELELKKIESNIIKANSYRNNNNIMDSPKNDLPKDTTTYHP